MRKYLIVFLYSLALVACNGAGGSSGDAVGGLTLDPSNNNATFNTIKSTASVDVRQRLFDYMIDRYLWNEDVPSVDLTDPDYADLDVLLTDLRKIPEDRFSGFVDVSLQDQRFEQGVTGSYGLRYNVRETDPLDIRISSVEDFGSVAIVGIQRGDRVIGAEGQSIDALGINGFRDLFSEPGLGVQRTLDIRHPDGTEQSYTITRTEHPLSPVRRANTFVNPDSGRRVGYVLVEEFISATAGMLQNFRANYSNIGLDDLIVDLRYNGGGLVSVSRDLASSIYGQGGSNDIYTELRRNSRHSSSNRTFNFVNFNDAFMNLQRVFILTTGGTCSASEEVINGLAPFMQVITIGNTTCGKPYASNPFDLIPGQVSAHILDSRSVNANGEGDFFNGLSPVCEAADDPLLPFTDPQESLISVALFYAESDRCPGVLEIADSSWLTEFSQNDSENDFALQPALPAISNQQPDSELSDAPALRAARRF